MSSQSTFPVSDPFVRRSFRLPPTAAFYLQASIVVAFLAASSAPTPLYAVYQGEWGFSPITTTLVFGIYALAVLAALLTVGSLSDHIGRRPVLLTAIGLQAVAMVVLTTAGGVPELMLARVVQGLSTGAAVGAVGAGMIDLDKAKGTIANAVAPMTGTATGALVSGLLVQYLPAPTHLVYLVILGVFLLQGVGVALMRETSSPKPGALASLRPRLGVPRAARGPLLVAVPVLVAVWALAGLYGSVVPAVLRTVLRSNSLLLGGLALFALAISGAVTVLLLRDGAPRRVMLFGTVALIVGVGVTLLSVDHDSALGFFAGTVVAGAGFGGGFQGAIRTVVPLAAPHERSGLLSTLYVVSYLAMGLPAVIGGFLVVHGGGLLPTTREYGVAVMVLAALALLGLAVPRRGATGTVVVAGNVPASQAGSEASGTAPAVLAEYAKR
ncbi:MFS transporter [Streptacidiphilus cavernicola]|uniref:MFS transporter n=1 Tax=Streptacidiphilus cavernicola TaxID=3342716 RepID=A0ABV6W433_9ACTN